MRLFTILCLILTAATASAQRPFYQNFLVEDGLPSATVYDIQQDGQGFIWFGTEAGVARFDGLSFLTFTKEDGLADNEVFDIFEDHLGRIWFYPFNKTLSYYHQGKVYNPTSDSLLSLNASGYFKSGIPTPTKELFIGSTGKNLIFIGKDTSAVIPTKVAPNELIRFDGNTLIYTHHENTYQLLFDFSNKVPKLLEESELGPIKTVKSSKIVFPPYSPTDSITDNEGNIWISTLGNGIFMQTYEGVYYLNDKTGLSHKNVYSVARINNKLITGYKNGSLDVVENGQVTNIHLSDDVYNRVLKLSGEQVVYAATDKALLTLSQDLNITNTNFRAVKCLDESKDFVFVGTFNGLYKVSKQDGQIIDKLYDHRTLSVCAEHKDTIWIGTNTGLFYFAKDTALSYAQDHPEVSGRIKGLEYVADKLVVGTHGEGLLIQDGATFRKLTTENGLISNLCNVLYKQDDSTLWLGTNAGLNRIRFTKENPLNPLIDLYTTSNGLISNYINDIKVDGNKAYVATDKGVTFFNLLVKGKSIQPTVYIRSIAINESDTTLQSDYKLSYDQNQVEIAFSAIAFKSGSNTKFKHRLLGLSDDWHLSSKTAVAYEALAPGKYTFEVIALTADGEESKNPATMQIQISPPIWKTWWFRLLSVLVIAIGVISVTRFLIQYNRRKDAEEKNKLLSEKNVEIEMQRQRSEELLLNILPEQTARELKENGKVIARSHDYATVFFSDFKGFTALAAQVSAEELVAELDHCFRSFDDIMDKHGIEKIKTIGDAYMCATGLNNTSSKKVSDMIRAAIDVVEFMKNYAAERKAQQRPYFETRIGIHVGKVVSGVVGSRKFAYDIWGDTVNTAARMESSGEVGKINVSQETYELIKDEFLCTPRGAIQAKGKGAIEMYFVSY